MHHISICHHTCSLLVSVSMSFCTARVPCVFRATATRSPDAAAVFSSCNKTNHCHDSINVCALCDDDVAPRPAACTTACKGPGNGLLATNVISAYCPASALTGLVLDAVMGNAPHLEALLLVAAVQHLLDQVVAEGVHHQLNQVGQHLRQHQRHRRGPGLVEFALQEPAAVAISDSISAIKNGASA